VVTFVDTPGAFPGIGAEERNQSEAIGRNLYEMAALRVPIVTTVIGEGGSGGALAIAIGDVTLMLQYAIYSVISPEGCAAILWKSAAQAPVSGRESEGTGQAAARAHHGLWQVQGDRAGLTTPPAAARATCPAVP
jgi:acetyl-CoA carboxylase alpha subunit